MGLLGFHRPYISYDFLSVCLHVHASRVLPVPKSDICFTVSMCMIVLQPVSSISPLLSNGNEYTKKIGIRR
jgi:hypothetical protein